MPVKTKPPKPKGSPLFPHANGQWAKKIRGKLHYFGPWDNWQQAVENYHRVASDLHAGRQPAIAADGLTVSELIDAFLEDRLTRVERGELDENTILSYTEITAPVDDWLGGDLVVTDLGPGDFARLMRHAAERWGPTRRGNLVAVLKAAFRWAEDRELIDRAPRYGPDFRKPARKLQRAVRREKGPRLFDPPHIRKMLKYTERPELRAKMTDLRAWILLGLNAGFGQTDISRLPRSRVDLAGGVIDWPRPKTGVERIVPLWPETVEALRSAFAARDEITPAEEGDAEKAFLTRNGLALVRRLDNVDVVGTRFGRLRRKFTKRAGLGFYALRHTFETVADSARPADPHAVARIMGHTLPGMKDIYNEGIDLDRLRHVTNHVRGWLFAPPMLFDDPDDR